MENSDEAIRNCVFSFSCKAKWEDLTEVGEDSSGSEIRFCSDCQREVYYCDDDQALIKNIKLNRCIAIHRHPFDDALVGLPILPKK